LFPNYRRFLEKTFGARARQLGWQAKPGEDTETRLLRSSILPLTATWGEDRSLATEARQLAEKWLADRNAVDPDMIGAVLGVAARNGDEAFFKELLAALPGTQDRQQRDLIFSALGSFRDPQIARASMELALKPDFDPRESLSLLFGSSAAEQTRKLPLEFVEKNYDAIVARIPSGSTFGTGEYLPFVGGALCDEKSREEVARFFEPKVDRFPGTRRNLAQVLESIRICVAYKAAQQESVAAFLRKY